MLKSLRPVEVYMLEKLLSKNEENLTECVDSIFEEEEPESNSFSFNKQYDDYPSNRPNKTLKLCLKQRKTNIKKSSSSPNLSKLNESNEHSYHRLNMTTDDQTIMNDEIDASFKKITKRIRRCVSQLLVKTLNTDHLAYENNHFQGENQFNQQQINQQIDQFNHHQFNSQSQQHCNNHNFLTANQQQQFSNSLATSQQSNSITGSSSSVDSYEISLALNAKGSNYVSALAKQLLHKLFVSISGMFLMKKFFFFYN